MTDVEGRANMSKSFSAAPARAPTSARSRGVPETQGELQAPATAAGASADCGRSPVPEPSATGVAPESLILTVDELAALLRLNRKTVYDALSRGEIPGARRVGSTYRILRAAVIDWLASGQGRVSHSKRLK